MRVGLGALMTSLLFFVLAFTVVALAHGLSVAMVTVFDLAVFSSVLLIYGFKQGKQYEKTYLVFWGLALALVAAAILVSAFYGSLYGLAILLAGFGGLVLYVGARKS